MIGDIVDRLHHFRSVREHLNRARDLVLLDFDESLTDVLDRIDDAIEALDEARQNVKIG